MTKNNKNWGKKYKAQCEKEELNGRIYNKPRKKQKKNSIRQSKSQNTKMKKIFFQRNRK